MLESLQHGDNTFVTLTYSDEHCPSELAPKHVTDWLKRLRFSIAPHQIRYYLVGEYGDQTFRPHYHAALFGLPNCRRGITWVSRDGGRCCSMCDIVADSWSLGNVVLAPLNVKTAAYIAGYVTKKMTHKDDPRLEGRHPEFARMSLRPGIGHPALHEIASEIMRFDLEKTEDDVPSGLRHGSSVFPLGRYLRRKLRLMVGLDEHCPDAVLDKMAEEMLPLWEAAFSTPRVAGARENFFKTLLVEQDDARVAQIEARNRIYKGSRPL